MFDSATIQKRAFARLESDLRSGRLAESYLFAGPEGAGKKFAALEFAKAINCKNKDVPCQACDSCRKADSGSHPEIFVLDFKSQADLLDLKEDQESKQKEYRIESIRAVLSRAHLTSMDARKKVLIVDGAEVLSEEAANALLKALEESPRQCLWILVTKSPERVLATVRSRCRKIWFSPPPAERAGAPEAPAQGLEKLAADFIERGEATSASCLELSAQAAGYDKKLGQKKTSQQFLKFLANGMASRLRDNPSPRSADRLLSILEAHHTLSRNVSPQMVLDSLLLSLR